MTREEKNQFIDGLAGKLTEASNFYLADVSEMTVEQSNNLRRQCYNKNVTLQVVKNTMLKKAMEKVEGRDYSELFDVLKGNTSIMFTEVGNAPAKLIKEFRKKNAKPLLKGAFIEEATYLGDDQLEALCNIKSREELIGDIITLLQSPAKNVISSLQSGKSTIAGIVKTLSERQ